MITGIIGTKTGVKLAYALSIFVILTMFFLLSDMSSASAVPSTVTHLKTWGSPGTGDSSFTLPRGIAIAGNGDVYVSDADNNRIQRFDSNGSYLGQWGTLGTGDTSFTNPSSLAFDSNNDLYVADTNNNRIIKFDVLGNYITKFGSIGAGDTNFTQPFGIAVDVNNSDLIYVADSGNDRIVKYDSTHAYVTKWGSSGTSDTSFTFPRNVEVDSTGNVYVVDQLSHRVVKYSAAGIYMDQWGNSAPVSGFLPGDFNFPIDLAIVNGNMVVTDFLNWRWQEFSLDGTYIGTFGTWGAGDGDFNWIMNIASTGSIVYTTEKNVNKRVQKFNVTLGVAGGPSPPTGFNSNAIALSGIVFFGLGILFLRYKSSGLRS